MIQLNVNVTKAQQASSLLVVNAKMEDQLYEELGLEADMVLGAFESLMESKDPEIMVSC